MRVPFYAQPLERRRSITSVVMDLQPSLVDIIVAPTAQPPPVTVPLHSFVGPAGPAGPRDVNVTSRDEPQQAAEMCAEEALDSMRRRNYPKVSVGPAVGPVQDPDATPVVAVEPCVNLVVRPTSRCCRTCLRAGCRRGADRSPKR